MCDDAFTGRATWVWITGILAVREAPVRRLSSLAEPYLIGVSGLN
jgi:hypothetical protein